MFSVTTVIIINKLYIVNNFLKNGSTDENRTHDKAFAELPLSHLGTVLYVTDINVGEYYLICQQHIIFLFEQSNVSTITLSIIAVI